MKIQLKTAIAATTLCAATFVAAPPVEAGGFFNMNIGTSGFGVSIGIGDWGPYTSGWTNPQFSLDFNATLDGYGEWLWVGGLGRVWRPWVASGWRPYTYGRWVRTTLGWTWVAYEPWGYVPHHYGSWAMCDFGWVWVPGYSYVSANVVWVRSGGYVGWYARPPWGWSHAARGYRKGYRDGYRDGWYDARYATYVDWHHMGSDNVSHYAVNHAVAAHGRVQDHAAPPTVDEVRRLGGVSVTEARLSQRSATMNGRRVSIARPEGVAASLERHAAETAAVALSPRALERRQPLVRPRASSPRAPTGARGEAPGDSSIRTLSSGGRAGISNQQTQRDSGAISGRRIDERTRAGAAATSARLPKPPGDSGSIRVSPGVSAQRSTASSGGRSVSESVDLQRGAISRSTVRIGASESSARSSDQRLSGRQSAADRPVARSQSSSRDSAPRITASQASARQTAVRPGSADSASAQARPSSRSSNARRRAAEAPTRDEAETDSTSARRPSARKKQ